MKLLKILSTVIFFMSKALNSSAYEFNVSITAIFHNDAPYLKEWLDYHLKIGVEHFWLYDDCSSDHWAEVLMPYTAQGIVEVADWSEVRYCIKTWPEIQVEAYKNALKKAAGRTKWLALIDTDEFILPMKEKTISQCLAQRFHLADAVFIQWLLFGTSGAVLSENDSMLRKLTCCASWNHPWNNVGKSIVRPERVVVEDLWNVHHVPLADKSVVLSGSGNKIKTVNNDFFMNSHQGNFLRINHYFFRDEKFYREVKIPRKLNRGMSLTELSELYDECFINKNTEIIDLINRTASR